jgi:hypothetical protein
VTGLADRLEQASLSAVNLWLLGIFCTIGCQLLLRDKNWDTPQLPLQKDPEKSGSGGSRAIEGVIVV